MIDSRRLNDVHDVIDDVLNAAARHRMIALPLAHVLQPRIQVALLLRVELIGRKRQDDRFGRNEHALLRACRGRQKERQQNEGKRQRPAHGPPTVRLEGR